MHFEVGLHVYSEEERGNSKLHKRLTCTATEDQDRNTEQHPLEKSSGGHAGLTGSRCAEPCLTVLSLYSKMYCKARLTNCTSLNCRWIGTVSQPDTEFHHLRVNTRYASISRSSAWNSLPTSLLGITRSSFL